MTQQITELIWAAEDAREAAENCENGNCGRDQTYHAEGCEFAEPTAIGAERFGRVFEMAEEMAATTKYTKLKTLAKALDLGSERAAAEYIFESRINGQHAQARQMFQSLGSQNQSVALRYMRMHRIEFRKLGVMV